MHVESVLNDQGQLMHRVYFEVQNNREPYLVLKLAEGQEILGAFIRGTSVRPTIRQSDNMRLIELSKSQSRGETFRVQLDFRENLPDGPLGLFGRVHFVPPEPQGMPVLQSTWALYLPKKDFAYVGFKGAMRLETGAREPWMVEALEYFLNDTPVKIAGGIARQAAVPPIQQGYPLQRGCEFGREHETSGLRRSGYSAGQGWKTICFRPCQRYRRYCGEVLETQAPDCAARCSGSIDCGASGIGLVPHRNGWVPVGGTVVFFLAASLTNDLAGRLFATALAASGLLTGMVFLGFCIGNRSGEESACRSAASRA